MNPKIMFAWLGIAIFATGFAIILMASPNTELIDANWSIVGNILIALSIYVQYKHPGLPGPYVRFTIGLRKWSTPIFIFSQLAELLTMATLIIVIMSHIGYINSWGMALYGISYSRLTFLLIRSESE